MTWRFDPLQVAMWLHQLVETTKQGSSRQERVGTDKVRVAAPAADMNSLDTWRIVVHVAES